MPQNKPYNPEDAQDRRPRDLPDNVVEIGGVHKELPETWRGAGGEKLRSEQESRRAPESVFASATQQREQGFRIPKEVTEINRVDASDSMLAAQHLLREVRDMYTDFPHAIREVEKIVDERQAWHVMAQMYRAAQQEVGRQAAQEERRAA